MTDSAANAFTGHATSPAPSFFIFSYVYACVFACEFVHMSACRVEWEHGCRVGAGLMLCQQSRVEGLWRASASKGSQTWLAAEV